MAACLSILAPSSARAQDDPKKGVVEFAPHVRIDWTHRAVELDATVILREGMLELFACSPNTREYESIVSVPARPVRIREALGLIGLTPGRPIHRDDKLDKWVAATGDPLRIEVRWMDGEDRRKADIGEWMEDLATGKPVPPGIWRFAGSDRAEDGTFLADMDGTVICVVDFSSALIGLGELKSADNGELWARANKRTIPPIGTEVTLILTSVKPVVFEIRIAADGQTSYDGEAMSMKRLVERIGRFEKDHAMTAVRIVAAPEAAKETVDRVADAVRHAVRAGTDVELVGVKEEAKVDHPPPKGDSNSP